MILIPAGLFGAPSTQDATLALGPYAYWRMSSTGATEVDVVNGHVGTYYGTPTKHQAGRNASTFSALFNLSSGLTIPDDVNFTPSDCTICGWAKMTSTGVLSSIITKYDGAQRSWGLRFDATNRLFFTVSSTTSPFNGWQGYAAQETATDMWMHFAISFGASGSAKLYINGRLCSPLLTNAGSNIAVTPANNNTSLRIGNDAAQDSLDNNGTINGFRGYLSDIALFTRVLTNAEIQSIVNQHIDYLYSSYDPLTDLPGISLLFDPQDQSTVFSDVSGTIPQVTNGGSVASIRNLADGAIWAQSNASYRPTLYSAGTNAPRSIKFATNNRLDSPGVMPITKFMAVAYKLTTAFVRHVIFGQYPNGNDTNFEINGANQLRGYYNGGDRGSSTSSHGTISKVTVSAYYQPSSGTPRMFLNAAADGRPSSAPGGASTLMYMGADIRDPNPALAIPFNGYMCGAIASSSGSVTPQQAQMASWYLMKKVQSYLV